jgi:nucleoside-diphosphate-sugar epimerase
VTRSAGEGSNSAGPLALVTGAAGFIPSHLVEELARSGWAVRCLLRYGSAGDIGFLADLPSSTQDLLDLRRGDLLDPELVLECCRDVDTVFHLGARISIPYSYAAPRDTFHVNALGTLNVVEAVRRTGVRRLVHVSTSEVFGSAVTVPMSETHRLKAQSPYAASKIAADKIVESYVCSFGLPAVIVRPFNTYGPRQSTRAVIPSIIEQALRGGAIRVGSLWPRRDFTYVSDTVSAFIKAATVEGALHDEFNLGTGQDTSIGDLAELIVELIGTSCTIVTDDARQRPAESEVSKLLSDNAKARKVLGWRPEVALREGLERVISWWRERPVRFGWGKDPN